MISRQLFFVIVSILLVVPSIAAQLQVGSPMGNGVVPTVRISNMIVGRQTTVSIEGPFSATVQRVYLLVGVNPARVDLQEFLGPGNILTIDLGQQHYLIELPLGNPSLVFTIVPELVGKFLYAQAIIIDSGARSGVAVSPSASLTPTTPMSKRLGTLPNPLVINPAAAFDQRTGNIYVIGGDVISNDWLGIAYPINRVLEINTFNPLGYEVTTVGACPLPASSAGAAFDPGTNTIYIFGGYKDKGYIEYGRQGSSPYSARIMAFNPVTKQCTLLPEQFSSGRANVATVYDKHTNKIYLIGGKTDSGRSNEVLAFDPSQRLQTLPVTLPSPSTQYCGTLYAADSFAAGIDDRNQPSTIYVLDSCAQRLLKYVIGSGSFQEVLGPTTSPTNIPNPLGAYSAFFDPGTGKFYAIGGSVTFYTASNKIYSVDPNAPSGGFLIAGTMFSDRSGSAAVYDPVTGIATIVGGIDTLLLMFTYSLVPEITWFKPSTNSIYDLASLQQGMITFVVRDDEQRNSFILNHATVGQVTDNKIYIFDEDAPLQPLRTITLPVSFVFVDHRFAWDTSRRKGWVFGGFLRSSSSYSDVIYEIDPASPTPVTIAPERLPYNGMSGITVVTDPRTNKVYLFGGESPLVYSRYVRDIHVWDPSRAVGERLQRLQTQLPPPIPAYPNAGPLLGAGAWNPQDNKIYLFGGQRSDSYYQYLQWILRFNPDTEQLEVLLEALPRGITYTGALWDQIQNNFLLLGGQITQTTQRSQHPTSLEVKSDEVLAYNPAMRTIKEIGSLSVGKNMLIQSAETGDARARSGVAYLPERGIALLFGGIKDYFYNHIRGTAFRDIFAFSPQKQQQGICRTFLKAPRTGISPDMGHNPVTNEYVVGFSSPIDFRREQRLFGSGTDGFLFSGDDRAVQILPTNVHTIPRDYTEDGYTRVSNRGDIYLYYREDPEPTVGIVYYTMVHMGPDNTLGTSDDQSVVYDTPLRSRVQRYANCGGCGAGGFDVASDASRAIIAESFTDGTTTNYYYIQLTDLGANHIYDPDDYRTIIVLPTYSSAQRVQTGIDGNNCFVAAISPTSGGYTTTIAGLRDCRSSADNRIITTTRMNVGLEYEDPSLSDNGQYLAHLTYNTFGRPDGFSVYGLGTDRWLNGPPGTPGNDDWTFTYVAPSESNVFAVAVQDEGANAVVVWIETDAQNNAYLKRRLSGPDKRFDPSDPPIESVSVEANHYVLKMKLRYQDGMALIDSGIGVFQSYKFC